MALSAQRLKRLVAHRERLERLQEQELAGAVRVLRIRQQALDAARASRVEVLATDPGSDLAARQGVIDYLQRLDREIAAKDAAVRHSLEDVDAERATLRERSRDRKAMESLLEKRVEEERVERNRADIRRLDDVAGRRWFDANGVAAAADTGGRE